MCMTCGCDSQDSDTHDHVHPHDNAHGHGAHDHDHHHHDEHPVHKHRAPATIRLERAVLEKNDRVAERTRGWLEARRVVAINLLSSPGAGKTTLLERTIVDLRARIPIAVIEGDQATSRDADRIRSAGARALQINTGTGCHLDASMVARALPEIDPSAGSLVMIENVGNLVCPALFDLGESAKVVVASVTEGDDKPLKYPHMFRAASLVLMNKMDLLPHVRFEVAAFERALREVNPRADLFPLSATQGEGMDRWYEWLEVRSTPLRREATTGAGS
jgi:hydrogenase nickel incorporation protein HypB